MPENICHSSSTVSKADFRYINKLAKENYVGYGPLCKELERQLAGRFSRAAVILTSSGEAALALALYQLHSRTPKRNEVVVSSYICAAVVNAILSQGLKPVFADVAPDSLNIGLKDVEASRLTDKTLAIICTHMGGFPDDMQMATQFGIPIISDCAQAIGASIAGQPLFSFGEISIASFGPTKFLTAGLGGAVLCEEPNADAIRQLASPELSVAKYKEQGFIRTMGQHVSDLNAGLVLSQLAQLDIFLQKRKRIAEKYDGVLRLVPGLIFPKRPSGAEPNWFRYYFLCDHAGEWQRRLQEMGVDARTSISHVMTDYFPQQGVRRELARQSKRLVSIPIYPGLKAAQVTHIIRALQHIAAEIPEMT